MKYTQLHTYSDMRTNRGRRTIGSTRDRDRDRCCFVGTTSYKIFKDFSSCASESYKNLNLEIQCLDTSIYPKLKLRNF